MNAIRSIGPRRLALRAGLGLLALFALIQLIPYGRSHSNPAVTRPARWTDARAEQLAAKSCYDCHSNLSDWPWYSNVAPASWLVQHDVDEARSTFNFSEWDKGAPDLSAMADAISSGSMPPTQYSLLHSGTKLSASEKADLIKGLSDLYRKDPPPARGGG